MQLEKTIQLFQSLPESFQREVIHFMEFLANKSQKTNQDNDKQAKSLFGHAKGRIYISPDFDEPLEAFEDYR
ncbi:MAG: DUF2281 domain-containing protein [Bacteroidia bacterium]